MAYIGKTPVIGNFQKCDSIAVVNGQAAYTLQVGGTNVSPQSENHMLVSLNGILQAPVDSFTVSGSTLTFASNLITGDVIDFVMILGNVLDLGVPSDNTVSLAKLTATGTKDATTFLRGDNTFAEAGGGKVLQVVSATDTTSRTTTSTSFVTASNTLSVNITPSSTSSKILLLLQANIFHGTGTGHCVYITLFKDGTNLNTTNASAGFSAVGVYTPANTGGYIFAPSDIKYIDSPATTSQITYDCRFRVESSSYTGKLNHTGANNAVSSLIAMEIGS